MRDRIAAALQDIESQEDVRILYACESGSRAWGFESRDSDYDVRFIYVHRPDWYLSIDDKRDVIECTRSDALDISGWDIRKTLWLLRRSNPPLLEWLRSPTVYMEREPTASKLRSFAATFFSPSACLHHYLHMAEGNYRQYLKGSEVRTKKYFYVLRPILACLWIEKHHTAPPMEFSSLLKDRRLENTLACEVAGLLRRKKAGDEFGTEPPIPVINEFLDAQIAHFTDYVASIPKTRVPDSTVLDRLFRETLAEAWEES